MLGLGDGRIAQTLFERVHFAFDRQEFVEGAGGLLEHRAPGVRQAVLRQVADGQRGRLQDRARIRLVEARHHLEERGLARAVGAAQADPFTHVDLPRDVVEQHAIAEGFCEVEELDHYSPSARAAAARTCGTRNGFVRYPATPRLTASIALDSVENPVMMMTGRSAL